MRKLLLALVFSLVTAPAIFAQPPPAGDAATGTLKASPRKVQAGQRVDVSGEGCAAGVPIQLELWNPSLRSEGPLVSGLNGEFLASVTVPVDARTGRAWIRASCSTDEGRRLLLDATIVIKRSALALTYVNVLFGVGTALVITGFGMGLRRRPRGFRRRHRRRRRRKRSSFL